MVALKLEYEVLDQIIIIMFQQLFLTDILSICPEHCKTLVYYVVIFLNKDIKKVIEMDFLMFSGFGWIIKLSFITFF